MGGSLQHSRAICSWRDRVTFHGFRSSDAARPASTIEADLFVLSSLHEAAGVVLLEAASCGVPVVGSAVGYLADWAPDAATAVAPGDPAALADGNSRASGRRTAAPADGESMLRRGREHTMPTGALARSRDSMPSIARAPTSERVDHQLRSRRPSHPRQSSVYPAHPGLDDRTPLEAHGPDATA